MYIPSPNEMYNQSRAAQRNKVADALAHCATKIQSAMAQGATSVRIWTGIEYGESGNWEVESALESSGYRVDGEMSLRHGHVIDVEWDAPQD